MFSGPNNPHFLQVIRIQFGRSFDGGLIVAEIIIGFPSQLNPFHDRVELYGTQVQYPFWTEAEELARVCGRIHEWYVDSIPVINLLGGHESWFLERFI